MFNNCLDITQEKRMFCNIFCLRKHNIETLFCFLNSSKVYSIGYVTIGFTSINLGLATSVDVDTFTCRSATDTDDKLSVRGTGEYEFPIVTK